MTTVNLSPIVQGNKWTQQVNFSQSGRDFTNPLVQADCRIRATPYNKSIYDFDPVISFASGVSDTFTVTLDIEGSGSAGLTPGPWEGDLCVYQSGDNFGPYTPIKFNLSVIQSITPPPYVG